MCHDSWVACRPALVGERLVTQCFRKTLARGFAAADEPYIAICLQPGTELAFDRPVRVRHFCWYRSIGENTATFGKLGKADGRVGHDSLEFANGRIVQLAELKLGQHATVVQLPPSGYSKRWQPISMITPSAGSSG